VHLFAFIDEYWGQNALNKSFQFHDISVLTDT